MALRRHMYTTNSTYSRIVVGVGTLSSTPSALDDGALGFTKSKNNRL